MSAAALPEILPDRTLRNFSYLFELNVNDVPLIVCGLNLTGLDKDEPSTCSMVNTLINYLSSKDLKPKGNITLDELKHYMNRCAITPVIERTMTQFWQLDNEPVETKEYWDSAAQYINEKIYK